MPVISLSQAIDAKRAAFIADLRAAADFFEAHPELDILPHPVLLHTIYEGGDVAKEFLAKFVRASGQAQKRYTDGDEGYGEVRVSHKFPGGLILRYDSPRTAVCERIVIRTEVIPERTVTLPAERKEVVEWRCNPILEAQIGGAA